jgi:hypothetical protein
MRWKIVFLTIACFIVFCTIVVAQWQSVAPGIDYQEFTLADPNNVFVARMDRATTSCIIDSCIAQGKLVSGREPVSGMANRYDDTFGYWGEEWGKYRYDVVAAINGSGFTGDTPTGGQIISGWYAKRFEEFDGSGPVWQLDRDIWLGSCVKHRPEKNRVTYPATGNDQEITGINRARTVSNDLIIYTPQYDKQTPVASDGVEVLVELVRPTMILPLPAYAKGYVKEIRQNQGSTPIPFDHIVLSAEGPSADLTLLSNVSIGSEVRVSQEITHYLDDCNTPNPLDWSKTYCSVRYMTFRFLKDGALYNLDKSGAYDRHPRTAVAYNSDYVYFIVVDGRSGISIGMTMEELGNFCLTYLSATDGMNMDGGGSSTLWVNGQVKNTPSDGSERWVTNGLMMISLQPKLQSAVFSTAEPVKTITSAPVRLGPGTNYASIATAPFDQEGEIVAHSLNGIYAKGQYWWKWKYGTTEGWTSETYLAAIPTAAHNWWLYQ